MEIDINPKTVADASLDVKAFESEYRSNFDLDLAIKHNLFIIKSALNEEKVRDYITLVIDWGQILRMFKQGYQDVMSIKVSPCKITGLKRLVPSEMENNTKFTLKEEKIDVDTFIVTHSFIPLREHHIENLLKHQSFDFVERKWKAAIWLD